MAIKFNWTPNQVDELDPHFLDELVQRIDAETTLEKKQQAEADRRKRRAGAGRRGR